VGEGIGWCVGVGSQCELAEGEVTGGMLRGICGHSKPEEYGHTRFSAERETLLGI
jgi:hypothetical protein